MNPRPATPRRGLLSTLAVAAAGLACAVAAPAASAGGATFMPECYRAAPAADPVVQVPARKGPYRLALVNGHTGIPWRMQMIQQTRAWAARPESAKDIKELKVVSTGADVASQIAAIDNFIQAGYDAIAFIAVNPKAFDAVIRRAQRAGTVLVSFDNPVDNPGVVRITPEWVEFEGDIKTRAVLEMMPARKGRLLEVRGLPGNSTDRDRHAGVRKLLAGEKEIEVVEVTGNWDTGTVQKVVADAFAVHGRFDAIVCQHGCRGVTNAMKLANHPPVPVGGDAENGFVKALVAQGIPGISVSTSPGQGPVAMQAAVALLQGQALPALVNLPTPNVRTRDMKPGVDYFPALPDTFETVTSYPGCGIRFTPEEINRQGSDNG